MKRKPNVAAILPSVLSILASGKSDEMASIELAELVGFEEIELVSELMTQRQSASSKV